MAGDALAVRVRRWMTLGPLYAALLASEWIAKRFPKPWPRRRRGWKPGVSVLIPERGTPDLLAGTLAAARAALARIDGEPRQLVVVVNGAPRADYAGLVAQYPEADWQFHPQPLGFNGAIEAGLRRVRHDAVYLLNSDMRLEPDALAALLPYRQPQVFAITSQIFFADPERRREETGWSAFRVEGAHVRMYERDPEDSAMARGNLYPGGGSSLLRADVLRRYVRGSRGYSPFYWEDADWGARAWADGWEVLFCPASRAHHEHRGTVSRYYDAATVDHVFARNSLLFELRHHWTDMDAKRTLIHVSAWDAATQREVGTLANARGIFECRLAAHRAKARGFDFATIHDKFYPIVTADTSRKPRVLLVSPFLLFPPAHGGARRVAELMSRVGAEAQVTLLSDERSAYSIASEPWFGRFAAVHLIEGRGELAGQAVADLATRIERHAHARLRAELARLIAVYEPDVVQIEFMELAALASGRTGDARWILDLHDVYIGADGGATDAVQRALMRRFDALIACSAEDAALLDHPRVALIANGAADRLAAYAPSAGSNLLFMGPFRYAPNREGIEAFLRACWPRIRAAIPDATLTILGGVESASAADDAAFRQDGVELVSRFVDPAPYLAQCALTINPQLEIRGSALKLIESLLAGRVCVSTEDGARGFRGGDLGGLVAVDSIEKLGERALALLGDPAARHAIERPADAAIREFTWDGIAQRLLALYRELA